MKISLQFLTALVLAVLVVMPVMAGGDNHSTVNKSLRIDDNSMTGDVDSVNGAIRIGANSFVKSIESVNGAIGLENDVTVDGHVEAVNGSITLKPGCKVGGDLETVNGRIRLHNSSISGRVETINGQIQILEGSEIGGDVVVRKPNGWGINWGTNKRRKPVRVEIGENVVVNGDLIFEHAVELMLHDSASVGEIIGDKVTLVGGS